MPVPDAEPDSGSEHNTGITGTRHAIAENQGTDALSPRHDRTGRPRLGTIKYAHSGIDDITPNDQAPVNPVPAGAARVGAPADDYDDETVGLVYEAPRPADAEPPRSVPVSSFEPPPSFDEPTPSFEPAEPFEQAEPREKGIAIFGDMATTEVPADEEPIRDFRSFGRPQEQGPPTAVLPTIGPAQEPSAPVSTGAVWNQPMAPPPQAVGSAEQGTLRPLRLRISGQRAAVPADDGRPRIGVRDLPPDVQLRLWRLRFTIMLVVGLAIGILTKSWVIGLTLAILAGIADTFYRSRRAPDYANGASQTGAHKRVHRQLSRMRRRGYFALDARHIPNTREIIDHLVVGPTGVYAIDSEKWDSKLPIRTWNGKKLYHGPASQKARLEHAAWEAQQASEILSAALGTEIAVRPALAIYGPKIPWDIATIKDVDVFTGSALRKYLKRRGRMHDGVPKLTREEARTIYDTAARMLPDVASTPAATPVG
jgi:hypothetical protein